MISKRNDTIFIVSQFLSALIFTIPIWIVFYQERVSVVQISLLVAIRYVSQMFFELPTGAFADLVGRKWSAVAGYFIWAVSATLILISRGFWDLFFALVVGGLGEALLSGALEALVYDSHKQDAKENTYSAVIAGNNFWYQVALGIATIAGGYLFVVWQGLPYLAWAVATLVAAVAALFFVEPRIDTERFTIRSYFNQMRRGTMEAFKSKDVALMSLFYIFVGGITWTNSLYFFNYIMVELGFPDATRGILMGGIRLVNVVVFVRLMKNDRLFSRTHSIYFFPIVMLLCFLPGVFLQGWWALPFVAGAVMAGTGRWIVLTRYTNELFDSKYRATAISALSMIVGIVYVIITSLSGPVIAAYGVRTVYTMLGVLTLVTVLPLSVVLVRNQKGVS